MFCHHLMSHNTQNLIDESSYISLTVMIIQSKSKHRDFMQLILFYNGEPWRRDAPRGPDIDLWAIMFYQRLSCWFNMTALCQDWQYKRFWAGSHVTRFLEIRDLNNSIRLLVFPSELEKKTESKNHSHLLTSKT